MCERARADGKLPRLRTRRHRYADDRIGGDTERAGTRLVVVTEVQKDRAPLGH